MKMDKKEMVQFYLENDILLSPEMIDAKEEVDIPLKSEFIVINSLIANIQKDKIPISIDEFEQSLVLKEKNNPRLFKKFLDYIQENNANKKESFDVPYKESPLKQGEENNPVTQPDTSITENSSSPQKIAEDQRTAFLEKNNIKIVSDYNAKVQKRSVQDFVNYFTVRYRELEKILRQRTELQNVTSIGKILTKKERDNVAIIGFVYEKAVTKSNNIMLTIEDPTGFIKVVVNQKREELFELAKEIQLDEVIGVTGLFENIVFANNILLPDIPLTKELKKSPKEGYFLLISDLQVGNKLFLHSAFSKLLSWLSGEAGNEAQRELAEKIKYIFIPGDLVDGVGIYPNQEFNLNIIDIYEQYKGFAELLRQIPKHIPIIICPGNHDVGRMSEPQLALKSDYLKPVIELPNVISVSNPSIINIFSDKETGFEGFDVLLYHGGSFFYYFANVPSIRKTGAARRPDLVMKYLLQRRHLAPSHTATLYVPDAKKDPLVIDKIPDFFFSGHIHRATVNNYRNITCINASCWVSKSEEEERRGLEPQPGRAFIINMQTREVKMMNFLSREDQEKEGESGGKS